MKKEFVKPEVEVVEIDTVVCVSSTCPTDCLSDAGTGGGGGMCMDD